MKEDKTPMLTGIDWRRVAWGGALVDALGAAYLDQVNRDPLNPDPLSAAREATEPGFPPILLRAILREQCIEEDLLPRERVVLRLRELGMLYTEIAPFVRSSATSGSRVHQVEMAGRQRLRDALARQLALADDSSEDTPGAAGTAERSE